MGAKNEAGLDPSSFVEARTTWETERMWHVGPLGRPHVRIFPDAAAGMGEEGWIDGMGKVVIIVTAHMGSSRELVEIHIRKGMFS